MSSPIYKPASKTTQDFKKVNKVVEMTEEDKADTLCGFWVYKPTILQPFAKIGCFTAFYSMAALMTSTLSSYVNSQVTTLERQFGFTSSQTGIILAANDIGYLACVLIVGYMASRIHIPRSLGIATITYGISGIACSLPHFLFGANVNFDPTAEITNDNASLAGLSKQAAVYGALCDTSNNSQSYCEIAAAHKAAKSTLLAPEQIATASLAIIVIGMALQGFGKAPRSSFTVTYVDDNTAKVNTGFYVGIITTLGILGPAVAFLMGGIFSGMYVTLEATKLTPRHPKWIGAWWLGYVVFGIVALIIAIPLFCFPRRLPRKRSKEENLDDQKTNGTPPGLLLTFGHKSSVKTGKGDANNSHGDTNISVIKRCSLKSLLRHSRDFIVTFYRLFTNPVYLGMVVSSCFTLFAVSGSSSYTPKYLERMFSLPAHQANYVMAAQTLCTSCLGTFIGGYLSKRLKMTAMKGIKFNMGVIGASFVAQVLLFVFQCEQPTVHNWPGDQVTCNGDCNCEDNSYFPICGEDGKTYYSPCHAGCVQVEQGTYANCTCIPEGRATSGTCDYGCSHLYGYAIIMGFRLMFVTLSIIPKMIVFIRSVSEKDRSIALAFSTFMTSLLGWLLGPILFGNAIDSVCTIWDITCETRGRCLLYDNSLFRVKLHGYAATSLACSVTCIVFAYLYARCTKCLDEPKDGNGEVKMTLAINDGDQESGHPPDEVGSIENRDQTKN
uniref:Solute carrier organic anion transporter family member n=2 Tax=Arion vulgaris TaxID=1028688 RepID=A0A0B7BPZ4_9EUPU